MKVEDKTEYVEVERVVKDKVAQRHIVLTLTMEEASALAAVTGHIGCGEDHPDSPRQVTDRIYAELGKQGVGYGTKNYLRFAQTIKQGMRILER